MVAKEKAGSDANEDQFLPDMCSLQAVFLLVLLGELLAVALTLADTKLPIFDWSALGFRSYLIQWVVLLSAGILCQIRPWLARQSALVAGSTSYTLVLFVAGGCSFLGLLFIGGWQPEDFWVLVSNILLAGILGGIVLRYLYVQQQWANQQHAELNARMNALQARIKPHFLFNTMNSIASLIGSSPEKAELMVEDLCELLRASLSKPTLIPLASEIELCQQYIAIEQIRLGDRLRVEWNWQPPLTADTISLTVPNLLLQPLLENAVKHGIQSLAEGGVIRVNFSRQGQHLIIDISNPVAAEKSASGNNMALENTRHRLAACFGPEAHLAVNVGPNTYLVSLQLPLGEAR